MRLLFSILVFLCCFSSCKNKSLYEKEISIIDSTKIVLQVKLNELNRAENNIESIGFVKYETYRVFLKNNIKDTVIRYEATALQQFVNSGKTIEQFMKNKSELIKQTETSIVQLQKLSTDVKENNLPLNLVQAYFSSEKSHAEELIKTIEQNIKAFNLSVNNYRNSIIKTEEYIRKINNGALPSVVPDANIE